MLAIAIHTAESQTAPATAPTAPASKEPTKFFRSETPIDLTFTANIGQLRRDKADKAPWRVGTLTFTGQDGKAATVPVKARTRGIWRLKNCLFPPVRLNIAKGVVNNTPLEGLDKPKLVNFCRDTDMYERYILQEYQLYRVHNLLTPYSHRARLVRLTYVDSATGKVHAKRYAFLLEEPEAVAKRVGGRFVEQKGASPADLDDYHSALFGVFEYMIANTDFSIAGLHNAELIGHDEGLFVPMAYDFDYSGAVNSHYAIPEPKLNLIGVRQRLYRGYCTDPAAMQTVLELFRAKKEAIYALYRDDIGKLLPERTVRETLEYFDEFYRVINDRGMVRSVIDDACLGKKR